MKSFTSHPVAQLPSVVQPDQHKLLYTRMSQRLEMGTEQQEQLLDRVSKMVIQDRLVPPELMHFEPQGHTVGLQYAGKEDVPMLSVHPHALRQLTTKVGIPATYVNQLQDAKEPWRVDLLAHILNEHYTHTTFPDKSGSPRFLHRIVDNELRGFLSRRFNRHLASAPILGAFLQAAAMAQAIPLAATGSDVKLALKMYLPFIFEPVEKQYCAVGVEWSNSDFGAGRMQVALTVWMPAWDRFSVLDHAISRVHIGSVIEDSDVELSDATAQKEAEAQASAVADAVTAQLSIDNIERLLSAIEQAHEDAVPWHRLKGNLARFLGKKEIEMLRDAMRNEITELPPIKRVNTEQLPSKWWASQAVAWLASKVEDPTRRLELEHAAGSFVEVK